MKVRRSRAVESTRLRPTKKRGEPVFTTALMRDLYKRLRAIGFDQKFLQDRVLPDWWDDSLGKIPSNRALAETAISRALGFPVSALRDPSARLALPPLSAFRLKRNKDTSPSDILPGVHFAFQVAKSVLRVVHGVPPFSGNHTAKAVRERLLGRTGFVDLQSVVEFAWSHGIVVLHLTELPKPSKKFSGIAAFCESRPVIVLGTGRDSPPWIAFHLCHEIGHLMLGHVTPDSAPLIDRDIDSVDSSEQEVAADEFACELLTGIRRPTAKAVYGLDGSRLAHVARSQAPPQKIDPGMFALVYGRNAGRMAVAQNALRILGLDRGGQRIVIKALLQHLPAQLPEVTERLMAISAA